MTDIVERLRKTASRGVSVWGDLQMEAADEIDALRARLAQQKAEPYLCIKPACGPDCSGCNTAISPQTMRNYAIRYARLRAAPLDAIKSGGVFAGRTPENVVLNGDDLDAALDGATPQAPIDGFGGNLDSAFDAPAPAPVVPDGWISVADRMPEKGVPVLALDSIGKYPIRACWIAKFTQEATGDFEGDTDYCEANDEHYWPEGWYEWNRHEDTHWFAPSITHWMPLPAAPGSAPAVQPLTDAQLDAIVARTHHGSAIQDFARAIEQAHGIGTQGGEHG